jgi:hypothetical protein
MNRIQQKAAEEMVVEHVKKFPLETNPSVAKRFGLSLPQVLYILRKTGYSKRNKRWTDPLEEGEWKFIPNKKEAGAGK